jgi:hypothetical protein
MLSRFHYCHIDSFSRFHAIGHIFRYFISHISLSLISLFSLLLMMPLMPLRFQPLRLPAFSIGQLILIADSRRRCRFASDGLSPPFSMPAFTIFSADTPLLNSHFRFSFSYFDFQLSSLRAAFRLFFFDTPLRFHSLLPTLMAFIIAFH